MMMRSPTNQSRLFAILAVSALSLAITAGEATAQGKRINKQQLVGTWKLVSSDVFGQNPKGILVFDRNGNYSLTIVRSDLPKFAAGSAGKGTAEENQTVMAGMVTSFGTYSLNEADKTITTHVEGSSYPNLAGGEQRRIISSLTRDELRYTNPTAVFGLPNAPTVWRRAK
jgi:hypothetical protein